MIPVLCFAQAGQLPADTTTQLDADLEAFAHEAFDAAASIHWIVVPEGGGFTAAEPSNTVVVSVRANRPLERAERTVLLGELSELCSGRTGKAPGEFVLSLLDPES